ncbi:uncharacterized protein PHALS_00493 [Plasmopara halstedii]|uniref:Uncharacterized protein n=1 Tax=Plasmopara halstedii TaxID=4781 RepID=A0A0P1A6E3_PLAHL|nr:uncharacterized protein PHALS_00493 [Plasmopara halstedii]CEG36169.1 hypothetical protein PHALS_00493 [Plasmopara halstedii]|eukprot:XP_024572538.1 hypothetical protein PHALS_00493 [Plasmopara halstedii]
MKLSISLFSRSNTTLQLLERADQNLTSLRFGCTQKIVKEIRRVSLTCSALERKVVFQRYS